MSRLPREPHLAEDVSAHLLASIDAAAPARWSLTDRGLVAEVTPLWAGVRPYKDPDGSIVREFRDPAQLRSPAVHRQIELLAVVPGHPVDGAGRLIFLAADAPPEGIPHPLDPEAAVLMPHSRLQVGACGDRVTMVADPQGFPTPSVRLAITDAAAIARVNPDGRGPGGIRDEVSPGFMRYPVGGPGVWTAPNGTQHPYDRAHTIDPDDPRVPDEVRKFVGLNYLGIGFAFGKSRGAGAARLSLDGEDDAPADATDPTTLVASDPELRPRPFSMVRVADESGVSGTGHVLDGVIWPAGQVTICWCSGPLEAADQVPTSFTSWVAFTQIHIAQHPGNGTVLTFDDGGAPPSVVAPELPTADLPLAAPSTPDLAADTTPPPGDPAMTLEQALAKIAELEKMLADLKAAAPAGDAAPGATTPGAAAPAAPLAAADALELTTLRAEVPKLRASVDSLAAEVKPHRERILADETARVASLTGVDAADLAGVAASDLPVAAMKRRIALGIDGAPGLAADLESDSYMRARFDNLLERNGSAAATAGTQQPRASADGVSPGFLAAIGGGNGQQNKPPARDTSFDLA